MSTSRIRIQSVVLALVLLPATAGVVAIHASAACQRFVRTYVSTPVRNRVSKATAAAWAKWRVGHPNWKPNPTVQRPKYVMTRKEVMQKVDFACDVPNVPSVINTLLTTNDDGGELPIADLQMDSSQVVFPDAIPPQVAEITPTDYPILPVPPYVPVVPGGTIDTPVPPNTPPVITDVTPEPASWLLVMSGMGVFGYLLYWRNASGIYEQRA